MLQNIEANKKLDHIGIEDEQYIKALCNTSLCRSQKAKKKAHLKEASYFFSCLISLALLDEECLGGMSS
jgi:hypothetical protein